MGSNGTRNKSAMNEELLTMGRIERMLSGLSPQAQRRVLDWLTSSVQDAPMATPTEFSQEDLPFA